MMKKLLLVSGVALSVLCATSCGSSGSKAKKVETATMSTQDEEIVKALIVEIDSLVTVAQQMYFMPFFVEVRSGEFTLKAQQQKVKPDYLLPLKKAEELQTLAQKNTALTMYLVDRGIAKLYGMPTGEYDMLLAKLSAEVNAPIFGEGFAKLKLNDTVVAQELVRKGRQSLQDARSNGTFEALVQRYYGVFIENMFILSQNPDVFAANFTDKQAADITYRIILLSDLADRIGQVYPDLKFLATSMDVLEPLNAMTAKELVQQLKAVEPKVEEMRNNLLK